VTKGRLAIIFFVGSIALALDQLLRFGYWEWNQLPTLWHHEGLALAGFVIAVVLLVLKRRARQKD